MKCQSILSKNNNNGNDATEMMRMGKRRQTERHRHNGATHGARCDIEIT